MSRIVLAWELGGDLGHLTGLLPLALALRARGHTVQLASRDLANGYKVFSPHGFDVLQAPLWQDKVAGLPNPPESWAELLLHCGYHDAGALAGLLGGWRALLRAAQPAFVVGDYSPTALLAARTLGIPQALYWIGFASPPRVTPLPVLRPWRTIDPARIHRHEARVLQAVNGACAAHGAPPLARLAALFAADEDFLCTTPELDHFERPADTRYWGAVYTTAEGEPVTWREPAARHVFAYVKPKRRDFGAVVAALRELDVEALVFAPGLALRQAAALATDRVRIALTPLRMADVLHRCDLVICHAGHGTLSAALEAGVPVLALPTQLEQYLSGLRVETLGAGRLVKPEEPVPDYRALIGALLEDGRLHTAAQAYAARHGTMTPAARVEAMAARIEELMR